MTRLKRKKRDKISAQSKTHSERPVFSLARLTTNKEYNFDYFKNNLRNEIVARRSCDNLLFALSKETWEELTQRKHDSFTGYEDIPGREIKFSPCDGELSDDEEVRVFRFGSQKYRIIGVLESPVLYIIGFDFNFSAYDHGA